VKNTLKMGVWGAVTGKAKATAYDVVLSVELNPVMSQIATAARASSGAPPS
jgi:hypothetical protein